MIGKKQIALLLLSTVVLNMVSVKTSHAAMIKNFEKVTQKSIEDMLVPDKNLQKALINSIPEIKVVGDITKDNLAKITVLDINNKNINSIEGLQYCTNLKKLDIGHSTAMASMSNSESNTISDLSPLSKLSDKTKLKILHMGGLHVTDFRPLQGFSFKSGLLGSFLGGQNIAIEKGKISKDGSLTLQNSYINIDGSYMSPKDSTGGSYNESNHSFTWTSEEVVKHSKDMDFDDGIEYYFDCKLGNESAWEPAGQETLGFNVKSPVREANDTLNSLFQGGKPSWNGLIENVNQEQIKNSKTLVDALDASKVYRIHDTNGNLVELKKADLMEKYYLANILYSTHHEVLSLFKDNDEKQNALAPGVNESKIDSAELDVEALKTGKEKKTLTSAIQKARQLLASDHTVSKSGETIIQYTSIKPRAWGISVPAEVVIDKTGEVDGKTGAYGIGKIGIVDEAGKGYVDTTKDHDFNIRAMFTSTKLGEKPLYAGVGEQGSSKPTGWVGHATQNLVDDMDYDILTKANGNNPGPYMYLGMGVRDEDEGTIKAGDTLKMSWTAAEK